MLLVLVKDNNVDLACKTLKRKLQREGVFRELKIRRYFEKLSDKTKRKNEEAKKRRKKIQYKFEICL